ncbi:MAG: fucose isomerase [Bacteroidetes bacterium]|nr:fucose isomerase [Bacteroidota bacterium]
MDSQPPNRFGIVPVISDLNTLPLESIIGQYVLPLKSLGGEVLESLPEKEQMPFFVFVATGGTEKKILDLWESRKHSNGHLPIYLIAHPGNNSLPAALEALAKLQQENIKGKIFYLRSKDDNPAFDEIKDALKNIRVYKTLKETKIGLIGMPSEWLVASNPDSNTIKSVWGPEIVQIELSELEELVKTIAGDEIDYKLKMFTSAAKETKEPSKTEIKNSIKVYYALKKIIEKYSLDAISVRCFDLITDLKTTGCYALAKLNEEGFIAGCEGDLVSTLSMLWTNLLTNGNVWMANPAQVDLEKNSLWLAHCTVPVNMVSQYKIRSHFESGLGVGIEGEFDKGKVTLLRLGGKNIEKLWLAEGEILESGSAENLCRTQVHVKVHKEHGIEELLTAPLGNHLVMLRGKHKTILKEWWEAFIN